MAIQLTIPVFPIPVDRLFILGAAGRISKPEVMSSLESVDFQ